MTARRDLDTVRGGLEHLLAEVPARMPAFRAAVASLSLEVAGVLARRWPPWLPALEAERLVDRGRRLIAEAARVGRIAGLVSAVEERAERLPVAPEDGAVAVWLERERAVVERQLAGVGSVHRDAELAAEEARLNELASHLARVSAAVELVQQLDRARESLPAKPDVAPLAARLVALRDEALAGHVGEDWLREARRFLAPLMDRGAAPPPPSRHPARPDPAARAESAALVERLTRLESWLEATGGDTSMIVPWLAGLAEATPEELQHRHRQASERLAAVIATAERERTVRRLALERQYADFGSQCGRPPEGDELEAELRALAARAVVDPVDHEAWLRDLDHFAGRLDDLVALQEVVLGKALETRLAAVTQELDSSAASGLSNVLAARRTALELERESLGRSTARRDVLARLVCAEDLLVRARELVVDARREEAELARLVARRTELLAALAGLPTAALGPLLVGERERALAGLEGWLPASGAGREVLAAVVARAEDVVASVGAAERAVRERRATLIARLEALRLAGLDGFEEEFLAHVEALVRGVAEGPFEVAAAAAQLEVAAERFSRYELQGRRRAADQVRQYAAGLHRALQGSLADPQRQAIERLLRELDGGGREQLPGIGWRRRAQSVVSQWGGANHGQP